jgi:hypothetical protein
MKQNGAVEVTTFHLVRHKTLNDFITENRDIDVWLRARSGFRSRHIFQDDSGRVHDLIFWDKETQGINSMKKLMEVFATSNVHALINQRTVNWFVQSVFS